jgi:hypothetical protein
MDKGKVNIYRQDFDFVFFFDYSSERLKMFFLKKIKRRKLNSTFSFIRIKSLGKFSMTSLIGKVA